MKIFFRIIIAGALIGLAFFLLFPHLSFRVERIEYFLAGTLKIDWVLAPILCRCLIGFLFIAAFLLLFYWPKIKWMRFVAPIVIILPFLFNPVLPKQLKSDAVIDPTLKENATLFLYASPDCPYCANGMTMLKAAQKKSNNFPSITVVSGNQQIQNMIARRQVNFPYSVIEPSEFMSITKGTYPLYILSFENGTSIRWAGPAFNYSVLQQLSK